MLAEKEGVIGTLSTQLQEMSEKARQADWNRSEALDRIKASDADKSAFN